MCLCGPVYSISFVGVGCVCVVPKYLTQTSKVEVTARLPGRPTGAKSARRVSEEGKRGSNMGIHYRKVQSEGGAVDGGSIIY